MIARDTVTLEGVGGLYKGLQISVLGTIPAGALYFGSYEFFKSQTLKNEWLQKNPSIAYLCGGMFAEIIACILFVPIDVIKERRQVQSTLKAYEYTSDLDAIRQIKMTEGIRGLYRAYAATVLSFGPFSALYFMLYEQTKGLFMNNDPEQYLRKVKAETEQGKAQAHSQDLKFGQTMFCSIVAGALAGTITNPLDMGKLLEIKKITWSILSHKFNLSFQVS